jgi:hypothetical protein
MRIEGVVLYLHALISDCAVQREHSRVHVASEVFFLRVRLERDARAAVARALPVQFGPVRFVLELEERRVRLAVERLLFLLDLDGLEGVRGPQAWQEEVRERSVLLDEVLEDGFERFGVRGL